MSVSVEDRFLAAVEAPGTWQKITIADAFNTSDLEEIRRVLQSARAILDAFDGILDAVGAFTSILRALESFINDVLLAALLALVDALDTAVKEFKSTGVYMLDLITPFKGDPNRVGDDCDVAKLKDGWLDSKTKALLTWQKTVKKEGWKCQTYEQFIDVIAQAFFDENDVPSPYLSQKVFKTFRTIDLKGNRIPNSEDKSQRANESDRLVDIFRPGRPDFGASGNLKFYLLVISAFDFTQFANILLSFSRFFGDITGNHSAVLNLIKQMEAYKYCLIKSFTKQAADEIQQEKTIVASGIKNLTIDILGYDEIAALVPADPIAASKINSSETPLYNDATQTQIDAINKGDTTRLYAIALKNLNTEIKNKAATTDIARKPDALNRVIGARISLENLIAKITQTKADIAKEEAALQRLKLEREKVLNEAASAPVPDTTNPYIKTICGGSDNFINDNAVDNRRRFLATRGTDSVDFYGLSAYQLFPGLFDLIEDLLQSIRGYAKPIATGISDLIDNIIKAIRQEIANLRQIIDAIERIIQYIEDFLNLNGISLLALDSTSGTYGLVNQLKSAQGFQGQGTGKEMFMAGIMIGVGYPSLDSDTGVFVNVGNVFEAQKSNIEGAANNLDTMNEKTKANAASAFNKFSQFFKT